MKALITSDDGVTLRLSLAVEGSNDQTLLKMLAKQYPALWVNPDNTQHVVVPIFEGHRAPSGEPVLTLEAEGQAGSRGVEIRRKHASDGPTIRRGRVVVASKAWVLHQLRVNGRPQLTHPRSSEMTGAQFLPLEDIVAGAYVEMYFFPRSGDNTDDGISAKIIDADWTETAV